MNMNTEITLELCVVIAACTILAAVAMGLVVRALIENARSDGHARGIREQHAYTLSLIERHGDLAIENLRLQALRQQIARLEQKALHIGKLD